MNHAKHTPRSPTVFVITGPESSGKSTLAKQLSNHYHTPFVPEFARSYLTDIGTKYSYTDLQIIAIKQQALRREIIQKNDRDVYVFDTSFLVLYIWSQVVFGQVSSLIKRGLNSESEYHYLLCKPDIPFEEDPLRMDEHRRDELYSMYLRELQNRHFSYHIIDGQGLARENKAKKFIDTQIK